MPETVAQGVAYEVNSGSFVTASVSGSIVESVSSAWPSIARAPSADTIWIPLLFARVAGIKSAPAQEGRRMRLPKSCQLFSHGRRGREFQRPEHFRRGVHFEPDVV